MILVGDVVAEMAVGLLDAQRIQRVQAAEPQADRRPGRHQRLEDMRGLARSET